MIMMNSILTWNVSGLNKARKQIEVARFISSHNISLFGLLETKVKRQGLGALYQRLCPSWCFTHNLAWHKGGSIIVAWKSDELKVHINWCSSQVIHIKVTPLTGEKIQCSFVYGASDKNGREDLFDQLANLKQQIMGPWLVIGDFNCIANLDERLGQRPRYHELEPLRRCMEICEIHDLKSTGRFFTWTNKQNGAVRVLSKIDRVMCNHLWDATFPTSEAVFLPKGDFDHTPMLVQFFKQPKRAKPFKIFNHWRQREDFLGSIQEHWSSDNQSPIFYRVIQNLSSIKNLCMRKFKKDQQAMVIQAEINLLKALEELHSYPTNLHLINVECFMADILKKAKSERDSALRQKAKKN